MSMSERYSPLRAETPIRASSRPVPRGASRLAPAAPRRKVLGQVNWRPLRQLLGLVIWLAMGVLLYEGARYFWPYIDQPIAKVNVEGQLSYVSQQAVQKQIAPYLKAHFFSVDLEKLQADLGDVPWIAHAQVRRVWPDQLVVHLEEQLPIARWGQDALLNSAGQAFRPRDMAPYASLPILFGPDRAKRDVMQQYQLLSQLFRPLGFNIERLEMRDRGSWYMTTKDQVEFLLGRDDLIGKVRRFTRMYEGTLKDQMGNVAHVDLRYPNGLSIGWRQPMQRPLVQQVAVH